MGQPDLHGAVPVGHLLLDLLLRAHPDFGLARLGLHLSRTADRHRHGRRLPGGARHHTARRQRDRDLHRHLSDGARLMLSFRNLLHGNRNYRYTWGGQVVSEIGDHFNNIAVFSLALATTKSGLVVSGVMLSRAVPAVLAGPIAGVLLDRLNRKHVMIASDLIRAVLALGFILCIHRRDTWMLYLFSALLMFASPFFTSGRSAILPTITTSEELHTANSLTQTTQWTTITIGTFAAGISVTQFGYAWAFILNSFSFLFSAWCVWHLHVEGDAFQPRKKALTEAEVVRPW